MWCPGSCVVFDCIDSRSLPSYLLKWVKVYCLLVSGKTIFHLGTVNIAMEGVFVVCGGGGEGAATYQCYLVLI